jgi:hypothetical protein
LVGSLCNSNEQPGPREEMLEDGGCYDEDGCDNGHLFCGIEIHSDADMEQLEGCTTVHKSVVVVGDAVSSLSGLKNIVEIGGNLVIWETQLTNLDGLDSLQRLDGIMLWDNAVLSDLSSVSFVNSYNPFLNVVDIERNPALANLDDLHNIESINYLTVIDNDGLTHLLSEGEFQYVYTLVLEGNDELLDLSGLGNVTELRDLDVSLNGAIQDLTGLESLQTVWLTCTIEGNAALVSLDGLSGLRSMGLDVGRDAMTINANPSLLNLDALLGVTSMAAKLTVDGNLSLPSCEVKEFVDYLETSTEWTADGNVEEEGNLADECSDLI